MNCYHPLVGITRLARVFCHRRGRVLEKCGMFSCPAFNVNYTRTISRGISSEMGPRSTVGAWEDTAPRHIPYNRAQLACAADAVEKVRSSTKKSGNAVQMAQSREQTCAHTTVERHFSNHAVIVLNAREVYNQGNQCCPLGDDAW